AVGGVPEQLPDERFGLLAAPGEPGQLVTLAARLLTTPALARSMARESLARCRDLFQAARMAADCLRVYRSLGAAQRTKKTDDRQAGLC
ncbi:MAG: hypothetical protein HQK81_07670, partial [Desulfovibrionaceae bacterium]|nr:hypothetical protein [Desulfovibrionaceae bacterium]